MALWPWLNDILHRLDIPPVSKTVSQAGATWVGATMELLFRGLGISSEPPMTRFMASQLATDHYFDTSASRCDLGFEPCVGMAEGIERLVGWLRGQQA